MGGGGGGRVLNPRVVQRLEQQARKSLSEAAGTGKQNVFLSFVNEDKADVNLLRGQAKNENSDIEFNDWSVKEAFDSENADYIRRQIRERIRQSSVLLVYVSDKTAGSKWVDWEVREATKLGKTVVAIYKGEIPPKQLPSALIGCKIAPIPWDQKRLSRAIRGKR